MKILLMNYPLATSLCLSALALGNVARADIQNQSLGADASATDRYRVTCSATVDGDTDRLATRITNNTASSPLMSVQAYKGSKATNTTDPDSGSGGDSPVAYVDGGNGTYFVAVDKAGSGAADYALLFQCETSESVSTGTSITLLQDR